MQKQTNRAATARNTEPLSSGELAERTIGRRAVKAVIRSLPASVRTGRFTPAVLRQGPVMKAVIYLLNRTNVCFVLLALICLLAGNTPAQAGYNFRGIAAGVEELDSAFPVKRDWTGQCDIQFVT